MFRRSTNNPWIPPGGLNSGYFAGIGGLDPSPVVSTPSGSRFPGQLGHTTVHSTASALKDSKTSVGTLFEGVYQLVKFSTAVAGTTGSAGTVKRGSIVYWDTLANNGLNTFTVTDVPTATGCFRAGIVINADTAIANVAGQFGYIQVAGLATGLYQAAVTSAVIGNLVIQGTLTTNVFDALADATAANVSTAGTVKLVNGLAYETPANNGLLRILMRLDGWVPNVG